MSAPSDKPTAMFRLPGSAYIAVLFFGLGITAFVRHPVLILLYAFPVLAAVFIARRSTVVDRESVTVRALFGTRVIRWADVTGLLVDRRDGISVALRDNTAVRLPYVRLRHLPVLSEITDGTVPDIPPRPAGPDATEPEPETSDSNPGVDDVDQRLT